MPMRFLYAVMMLVICPGLAMAQERVVPDSPTQMQLSFAPVVKRVTPGVVNIYTRQIVTQRISPFMGDPFFEHFFGGALGGTMRPRVENSLGSGVIVNAKGLIVTNAHVAKNADEIRVVLSDRREFPAALVMVDEKADLALLQMDTKNADFSYLTFGDSDALEVGDLVLAVGNPFGVGQTVTSGIVSAVARSVGQNGFGHYIQTDAAINPGNSGGALVNLRGEVVGINTMIFSKTGGYMGIGFAVPSILVRQIVANFEQGGTVQRAWFGARLQSVTNDIALSVGMDRPQGILVAEVFADSPADKAGIKRGDIILSVDGRKSDDEQSLRYVLATKNMGDTVPVVVWRDGKNRTVSLTVAMPPKEATQEKTLSGRHPLNGVTVAAITPVLAEEMADNLPSTGILVKKGRNMLAGPGDVILAINNRPMTHIAELESALGQPAQGWKIDLWRNGQRLTVMVR